MQLDPLDWIVVVACLLVSFTPALLFARRAGQGTAEFFASGRAAPWWLLGTSMVATTFSTDTPNLVTDFVRNGGVSRNWAWWAFLLTGMMTVFFYARLWRRSGVLTDLELYELRYSGRAAAFVRGFRAVYLGIVFNAIIMATVTLAAAKIAGVLLGWDRLLTVIVCGVLCILFSTASGLWGVIVADVFQFAFAMVGVVAAAVVALRQPEVGGLAGLVERLPAETLSLVPSLSNTDVFVTVLVLPLAVQWWSVWYPGAEPGGGSYIAQRMLAARSEKDALKATLWFNVAHYALRPWPWILVALCSLLVFPTLDDLRSALPHVSEDLIGHDLAYPAMLLLLPAGLKGLLLASLLSAYISTMSTHLNWGASYVVHDLYRRFLRDDATERHYVGVSRITTVVLMVVSGALMFAFDTASDGFRLLLSIGAGTGALYLLRWFWWRVNAWSEIAAMVASFTFALCVFIAKKSGVAISESTALLVPVTGTTIAWVAVTFLTRPSSRETLLRFYEKVRPMGPGWAVIREESGLPPSSDSPTQALLGWSLGCLSVYAALFGTGMLLYGRTVSGAVLLLVFVVSFSVLLRLLRR